MLGRKKRGRMGNSVQWATLSDASPPEPAHQLFIHDALRVVAVPGKGRGFVATRGLPAGTRLLSEPAFAALPSRHPRACARCAAPLGTRVCACADCGARFCSPDCRRLQSDACESEGCDCAPADEASSSRSAVLLALRALAATPPHLRSLYSEPHPLCLEGCPLEELFLNQDVAISLIASLPTNGDIKPGSAEGLLADFPWEPMGEAKPGGDALRQLARLVAIVSCNAFSLINFRSAKFMGCLRPVRMKRGIALFAAASLFNHACSPNTNWHMPGPPGNIIELRTVAPVQAGEELCISYGHYAISAPTFARREHLFHWGFICECPEACGRVGMEEVEAGFWGLACPATDCPGPAALLPHKANANDRLLYRALVAARNPAALPPLILHCPVCGFKGPLPGAQEAAFLLLVRAITGKAKVSAAELRSSLAAVHPANQFALLARFHLADAESCPDEFLHAADAVMGGLGAVGGPDNLKVGLDALVLARILATRLPDHPAARDSAARLADRALAVFRLHFGPDSPFALQTIPC